MTDRSMFDEDYDPADVVLPRMSRNRRVIGRLPIDHTEPSAECAACGDLWLKAAQEALRRAERAEAQVARVRALCDDNSPAFNPGGRTAQEMVEFERTNRAYVEGWDDAVDLLRQTVMAALDGTEAPA